MVLVIGLVYILIVMLACVTTLDNVSILAIEQTSGIKSYKKFYKLESDLVMLEERLKQLQLSKNNFDLVLLNNNIIDVTILPSESTFETRWKLIKKNSKNFDKVKIIIEFLGTKPVKTISLTTMSEPVESWLFRISVAYWDDEQILQTILQIYPREFDVFLQQNNKPVYRSQRIAWYNRILDE